MPLPGLEEGFLFLSGGEKNLASQLFELWITEPEAVDKVKIRAERREMVRRAADEHSKEIIGTKLGDPVGKAGKLTIKHEDKGTQDLGLVDGRPASIRVESGKEFAHRIKVHGSKFVPGIRHGIKFFKL